MAGLGRLVGQATGGSLAEKVTARQSPRDSAGAQGRPVAGGVQRVSLRRDAGGWRGEGWWMPIGWGRGGGGGGQSGATGASWLLVTAGFLHEGVMQREVVCVRSQVMGKQLYAEWRGGGGGVESTGNCCGNTPADVVQGRCASCG